MLPQFRTLQPYVPLLFPAVPGWCSAIDRGVQGMPLYVNERTSEPNGAGTAPTIIPSTITPMIVILLIKLCHLHVSGCR